MVWIANIFPWIFFSFDFINYLMLESLDLRLCGLLKNAYSGPKLGKWHNTSPGGGASGAGRWYPSILKGDLLQVSARPPQALRLETLELPKQQAGDPVSEHSLPRPLLPSRRRP